MDDKQPKYETYFIKGNSKEEIDEQLDKLEQELIQKFDGDDPEVIEECKAFVDSIRQRIFKEHKFVGEESTIIGKKKILN